MYFIGFLKVLYMHTIHFNHFYPLTSFPIMLQRPTPTLDLLSFLCPFKNHYFNNPFSVHTFLGVKRVIYWSTVHLPKVTSLENKTKQTKIKKPDSFPQKISTLHSSSARIWSLGFSPFLPRCGVNFLILVRSRSAL